MTVAIVTGSDSGIGRATAVALAEDGFDVGVTWHSDEEGAEGTAREVSKRGRRVQTRRLDLTALPEAADQIDDLCEALGGIDVLVNCAGAGASTPFVEAEWDAWRSVLDVDLNGAFLCSQRAARRMLAQGRGGRIVNVTSVHEHIPLPNSAAYVAAKHGLGGLTKQMAYELAPHGITVNAVAPGEIATRMNDAEDANVEQESREGIPSGRPGDAREVASLVAWLVSPGAGYATGHSFVIDGGLLLMAVGERRARPAAPLDL
jgi:NAD(P)-dependent dehydrogenase (short-subunit alcohol dehydrogenase family)